MNMLVSGCRREDMVEQAWLPPELYGGLPALPLPAHQI